MAGLRGFHECYAADKSATAYGDYYGFDIRQLFKDFKSDSALSGNDIRVIERVDERVSFLLFEFQGILVGIIVDSRHKAYVSSIALCRLYFAHWRAFGKADD